MRVLPKSIVTCITILPKCLQVKSQTSGHNAELLLESELKVSRIYFSNVYIFLIMHKSCIAEMPWQYISAKWIPNSTRAQNSTLHKYIRLWCVLEEVGLRQIWVSLFTIAEGFCSLFQAKMLDPPSKNHTWIESGLRLSSIGYWKENLSSYFTPSLHLSVEWRCVLAKNSPIADWETADRDVSLVGVVSLPFVLWNIDQLLSVLATVYKCSVAF